MSMEGSNNTFDDALRTLVMNHKNDELKTIFKTLTPSKIIDNQGMTLLHLAARYGNLEMIEFSLASGCDLDARNSSEATPLFLAILHDKYEAAKCLLNAHADILSNDAEGKSTLQLLTTKKKRKVPQDFIEFFIEKLKNNNKKSIEAEEMTEILVRAGCSLVFVLLYVKDALVMQTLLRRKSWICQKESSAALEYTVKCLDLDNLRILTHHGVGAAKRKKDLFNEIYRKNFLELTSVKPIVRDLINWDIDEALVQFLQNIFEKKPRQVVQMFMRYEIDIHVLNNCGQNLLAHLFANPNKDVIELLKERQFDVNTRGRGGISALHAAVINGLNANVKLLLNLGADPNAKDDRGRTPLLCSNAWLSPPIAEHLFQRDVDDDYTSENNECIAELLLRHGADIQIIDDSQRTVIEVFYYLSSMEPILARLAIAEAQGMMIDQLIKDRIDARDGYRDFYDKCVLQIEHLRIYKVCKNVTLLTAFTEKAEKIRMKSQESIDEMLDYCNKREIHRVYTVPLKAKLEKALRMYKSRCRAAVVIAESTGMLIGPDDLVTEKIISFLSYDDLLVFQ